MNLILEFAMLAPAIAIAAINVGLYLSGERGTLLVPVAGDLPMARFPAAAVAPEESLAEPHFEEELRLAA